MALSKAIVDRNLRNVVASNLGLTENEDYTRVGNQSFYTVIADENGVDRRVEVRIIVGRVSEDITAQEEIDSLVEEQRIKDENKAIAEAKAKEKAKRDKEKREAKKKEKEKAEEEAE